MKKQIKTIEIKCSECKGCGSIGMDTCPFCGGDPMDPDSNMGSGKIKIDLKLLRLFVKEAKKQGIKI